MGRGMEYKDFGQLFRRSKEVGGELSAGVNSGKSRAKDPLI
jgi:hypothetical protein